jgi:phosphoribosylglycinamide formyltransferase-1
VKLVLLRCVFQNFFKTNFKTRVGRAVSSLENPTAENFRRENFMKIGILISGRGSNMKAIVEAVQSGAIPDSEVVVVISDKNGAEGLEKARARSIETAVVERNGRKRAEHDAEIISELQKRNVELVCLAGYMRLLSKDFVQAFPNKIVNIHPSLLPSFPGLDAQKQAIEYGVKISGCTVHFVDEALDHGAIILQKAVEVADDETAESLSAKILEHEHALYVEALRLIAEEKIRLEGRTVKARSSLT